MVDCLKWESLCHDCPLRKSYALFKDRSKSLYNRKKQLFEGIDLTIVTPSEWLAQVVKQSFLKDYPVQVINNGIDLKIFRPVEIGKFRSNYKIDANKKILLGVAFEWGIRKGLDVFIELAKRLDSNIYQIVLVGTNDTIDKQLPTNILSIHRTQNQQELAEIYADADLFINPTREENFPTVNIESLACGTPVLTYRTGGSAEMLDETCGFVVERGNIDELEREIIRICTFEPFSAETCVARAELYDKDLKFREYLSLYMNNKQ